MGELLSQMEKQSGARGNASNLYSKEVESPRITPPKTLSEMGVTKNLSSQSQNLAVIVSEITQGNRLQLPCTPHYGIRCHILSSIPYLRGYVQKYGDTALTSEQIFSGISG